MARRRYLPWEAIALPLVVAGCYATYRQNSALDKQFDIDNKTTYAWVREQKIRSMVALRDQKPVPAVPAAMGTGGGR